MKYQLFFQTDTIVQVVQVEERAQKPTTTELCQKFEIKAKISKAKGHHNKSFNSRYVRWSTWSEETLY